MVVVPTLYLIVHWTPSESYSRWWHPSTPSPPLHLCHHTKIVTKQKASKQCYTLKQGVGNPSFLKLRGRGRAGQQGYLKAWCLIYRADISHIVNAASPFTVSECFFVRCRFIHSTPKAIKLPKRIFYSFSVLSYSTDCLIFLSIFLSTFRVKTNIVPKHLLLTLPFLLGSSPLLLVCKLLGHESPLFSNTNQTTVDTFLHFFWIVTENGISTAFSVDHNPADWMEPMRHT